MFLTSRGAAVCRRSFLRGVILAVCGGIAGAAIESRGAVAADRKLTQAQVIYRDKAQGESLCSNCKYFQAPASCAIIEGVIAPSGWCNKYAK
ncbi:high potential iron sulfur protein [Telmatospirillum siberiense]|uniref:High-potential iron-sulfur protein n=2 Tax=Telmatospirillum siberiense TaxID=382514 RepID=A0A2N3PZ92_9PROT|nr:high potential iron sulfur protein [Telmatospirillum siberiense]